MQGVRPLGKGICIGNTLGDQKKYDLGYSGPMNDNGSVRAMRGVTTVKVSSMPG